MKASKKWAIVLEGTIVVVLAVFLSVLVGCKNPTTGETVTATDAAAATQTVAGAVSMVMVNQVTNSTPWQTVGNVSYSTGYGVSMTGTDYLVAIETSPTTSTSTYNLNLTITFNNYTDPATGYTVNGAVTVTAIENGTSYAVESGSITTSGALALSGGKVTSESWNVTDFTGTAGSSSGTPPVFSSFTGNATCNGVSFDASSLSLGATSSAVLGAQAVLDSITAVMTGSGSWTISTGTVTYRPGNGVSMTGTYTTSGSTTTYKLKLTFSGYADSTTAYTLTSGTVTVVVTSGSTTSYLISGGPIVFSGGPASSPVTSQTWTNLSTTSLTTNSLTGTALLSNGVACDPRTL